MFIAIPERPGFYPLAGKFVSILGNRQDQTNVSNLKAFERSALLWLAPSGSSASR